jgi:uncharacterized protein (TIGR02600 family)
MKSTKQFLSDARRHKGLALIIVLSMLALATIVILAFLSVADTEHKATVTFSSAQSARRTADVAVNMVIGQIRSGSAREPEPLPGAATYSAIPVIHATQPGSIRKYNQSGHFMAGYKLFSDANMIYRPPGTGQQSIINEQRFVEDSEPPADWDRGNNTSRYVDLNEPVVKGVANSSGATTDVQTIFPIIDPRAGRSVDPAGQNIPVEGFSYSSQTALKGNDLGKKVVLPPESSFSSGNASVAASIDEMRLPMPVQWLYQLRDGTIGYLDPDLTFQSSGSSQSRSEPSAANPIVARFAFWTDDETCKVNINTAAEPTFMGQPIYYHERDHRWADFPPARSEFQRFPGHPATTALSSVIYPNPFQTASRSLDTYRKSAADLSRIISVKEKIYDLMPRIHTDGSRGGTQLFGSDDFNNNATIATEVAMQQAIQERLYATVDELLFSEKMAGDGRRQQNNPAFNGGQLFNPTTLERMSAFLTASSRGSEISMFGLPKIAMWPIHQDVERRTGFDKLIHFCSTLGPDQASPNIYIFQRARARDADFDINISRNKSLMDMLDKITRGATFPSKAEAGGVNGNRFDRKFGPDNMRQLLVAMFDYIRCTNLYDSYLAPKRDEWRTRSNTDWVNQYRDRDIMETQGFFKTYTPGFVKQDANEFNDRSLPGHGQVTPSVWRVGGSHRGYGRTVSISEVGIQFICTADGQPDMYSWRIPERDPSTPPDGYDGPPRYRIPLVDHTSYQALRSHPDISGGRTALKIDRTLRNDYKVDHVPPLGFDGNQAVLTNLKTVHWANPDAADNLMKARYYSNYPPMRNPTQAGYYGTTEGLPPTPENYPRNFRLHPGYDWRNWNYTLDWDTPLTPTQKRIQAMLHLEFFSPSVGYPELHPEFTLVVTGVSSVTLNNQPLFSITSPIEIKSGQALYHPDDHPEVGGFASFRRVASGRLAAGRGAMPPDPNYGSDASGDAHSGLTNLDLVSSFITVDRDQLMSFQSGVITVQVYDSHNYAGKQPIQTVQFQLKNTQAPAPELVVMPSYNVYQVRADNSIYNHPAIQAPRWWAFNRGGALGRIEAPTSGAEARVVNVEDRQENGGDSFWNRGRMVQVADATVQATTARDINRGDGNNQRFPGANQLIYGYENNNNFGDVPPFGANYFTGMDGENRKIAYDPGENYNKPQYLYGTDTVRSLQPKFGDARIFFARMNVRADDWTPHVLYDNTDVYNAHNFSSYHAGGEPGFDRYGVAQVPPPAQQADRRILPPRVMNGTSILGGSFWPDAPANGQAHVQAQKYMDFDDSDPGGRIGPFINKPDEGNFAVGEYKPSGWPDGKRWRATYFRTGIGARTASAGRSFFTPNRMISSPIMMGSLPPTVYGLNRTSVSPDETGAWRTLLFRPNVQIGTEGSHPGGETPPDHYLLDLFWMPVVEPYAISEALSTAGKINMNYQMMPFTHIRRATGLHALMKGELFAAMPDADYEASKSVKATWGPNGSTAPVFRDEQNENRYWHRSIVVDRFPPSGGSDQPWWRLNVADRVMGTLRQFEERFNFGRGPSAPSGNGVPTGYRTGLFRSPTQICEIHLIPSPVPGSGTRNVAASEITNHPDRNAKMAAFWQAHCSTGDNTRERPYSNLYTRLTTRSNTFRVHVRAQTIRKATRDVAPNRFDPAYDQVISEYRGSFLLERYIDPRDTTNQIPDYATAGNPFAEAPLESFYRFRILETKRFAP